MNPLADDYEYRTRIKRMMPSLEQIDADRVGFDPNLFGRGGNGGSGSGNNLAERMREMQELAVERALEQRRRQQQQTQQS